MKLLEIVPNYKKNVKIVNVNEQLLCQNYYRDVGYRELQGLTWLQPDNCS